MADWYAIGRKIRRFGPGQKTFIASNELIIKEACYVQRQESKKGEWLNAENFYWKQF